MLQGGTLGGSVSAKVRRLSGGVPIVMYHLVSPDRPSAFHSYSVTAADFRAQVGMLTRLRCTAVSPDDLFAAQLSGRPLPKRAVLITFDDGFEDCLRHAAPALHEAGFQATMYVVAGLLASTSRWMADLGLDLPLVSAAQVRELEQAGVRCESHSVTHPRLASLSRESIREELCRSRATLEDLTGHTVRHLAYPHGSYDGRVRGEALAAGYQTAYTTRPGKAVLSDDPLAMPRVKVDGRDGRRDFLARLVTGHEAGYAARRIRGRTRA